MDGRELEAYRLTPQARTDLEDIWLFSAERWSVAQADAYVGSLVRSFEALRAMPEIARERTEFTPPVRIHPSGRHVIVYLIGTDHLLILRILGARQDWQKIVAALED